ncbi:MAG: hypothetical protein KAS17_09020, partial [Victivallaceae bacterium]|nr:hypothetical protein [Victivallaceae bacterium]
MPFSQIGSTSKSSNTGSGDHWLSAGISASNWYFVSRSKSGSPSGTWITDTSKNKTATFNLIHKPGTFSMSISGKAEPSGGSGGGYVCSYFSVNKSVPLNYAISPSSPANVPCGESSELINFKENGISISAYWKAVISGGSGSYGTTLISSYYFSNSTPGIYTISAKRDEATGSATIKNIGVASISGHGKTSTESAEANLGDDETIFCAPYIDASLTANTDPSGQSWPTDEPTWHCECSWPYCQHLTANGASCVFNGSGTGAYIVRAECGNSHKRIKIENLVPKLYSVEFTDDITIKRDTGTQATYSGAHWKDDNLDGDASDANDACYPVAYVSTDKCKVGSAVFKLPNSKSYDVSFSAKVRFDTSFWSSYSSEVTGSASGSTITCSNVQFPDQFESSAEVGHDSSYSTRWDISFNDGDNWTDIDGDTSNELYLTLQSGATTAFETVLHIGCTNADGETTAAGVVADIWSEFSDRDVRSKSNMRFIYWLTSSPAQTLADMLKTTDGDSSCLAFAQLLEATLEAQGLSASVIELTPVDGDVMLVKNWNYGNNINSGPNHTNDSTRSGDDLLVTNPSATFNWTCILPGNDLTIDSTRGGDDVIKDGIFYGTNFPYAYSYDVKSGSRIPAQGNNNSPGLFVNHFIIKAYNKFYDPSYGGSV